MQFCFAGGSSAADIALLIFSAGDAVWCAVSTPIWLARKLDCLPHQHSLHRIQNQKGKRESRFQKPCHPGSFIDIYNPIHPFI